MRTDVATTDKPATDTSTTDTSTTDKPATDKPAPAAPRPASQTRGLPAVQPSNRQAGVFVLLLVVLALLLFGKGKLPRAWGALWGPPSPADATMGADAQSLTKGALGFGAASLVVLAVSDTALYPVALGVLVVAILYLLIYGGGLAAVKYFNVTLSAAGTAKPAAPSQPVRQGVKAL